MLYFLITLLFNSFIHVYKTFKHALLKSHLSVPVFLLEAFFSMSPPAPLLSYLPISQISSLNMGGREVLGARIMCQWSYHWKKWHPFPNKHALLVLPSGRGEVSWSISHSWWNAEGAQSYDGFMQMSLCLWWLCHVLKASFCCIAHHPLLLYSFLSLFLSVPCALERESELCHLGLSHFTIPYSHYTQPFECYSWRNRD